MKRTQSAIDPAGTAPSRWRATGSTVRGASHEATATPNQDAIGWNGRDGASGPLVLAVADGHGNPRCIRSEIGARLSVETATQILGALDGAPPNAAAREALSRTLVAAWRERVSEHIAANPFGEEERATFLEDDRIEAEFLAYGATMLGVRVTSDAIVYVQIGDGDILASDECGRTTRIFRKDPSLADHQTFSLCQPDAWRRLHVATHSAEVSQPALLVLATDGFGNSFACDRHFIGIGKDLLDMVRASGFESLTQRLQGLLDGTSRAGSRDDIALGIVKRTEAGEAGGPSAISPLDVETIVEPARRVAHSLFPVRAFAKFLAAAAAFAGLAMLGPQVH